MALPIKDGKITTPYGKKGKMWKSGKHSGVDFAVPQGTDVLAALNGKVAAANWGAAFGTHIVQKVEGQDVWVIYAHLSKSLVKIGDTLTKNQHIGESGNTGNSSGPHLHFEARNNVRWSQGQDINPKEILEA
jgi:murein DD-endopeptidase MepM/ murein hydrolase activator NlpD